MNCPKCHAPELSELGRSLRFRQGESKDPVAESKRLAKIRREGAKVVKKYLTELLNGANSHDQIADAIANYGGQAANDVFKGAINTILEMQSHNMPANLIKTALKLSYGEEFSELVAGIFKLSTSKNGQITMQKGWQKQPLPVNLNSNSGTPVEKSEQNGSKQHPFAIANAPLAHNLL
jgi:uncharacterized protein YhdP